MTQTDHMAALSRREYREVGKRPAMDCARKIDIGSLKKVKYRMNTYKYVCLLQASKPN